MPQIAEYKSTNWLPEFRQGLSARKIATHILLLTVPSIEIVVVVVVLVLGRSVFSTIRGIQRQGHYIKIQYKIGPNENRTHDPRITNPTYHMRYYPLPRPSKKDLRRL